MDTKTETLFLYPPRTITNPKMYYFYANWRVGISFIDLDTLNQFKSDKGVLSMLKILIWLLIPLCLWHCKHEIGQSRIKVFKNITPMIKVYSKETIQLECEAPLNLLKNDIYLYLPTSSHVKTSVYFPCFF